MLLSLLVVGCIYPLFLLLGAVPRFIQRLATLAFSIHILFLQQLLITDANFIALDGLIIYNSTLVTLELFIVVVAIVVVSSLIGIGHSSYDYLWLVANVIGIGYLLASKDWLVTIAAGEVFNLSLYLLAGVIGLQYFLLSALATTLLIFGVAIMYALTGTTHYEGIILLVSYLNSTWTGESAMNLVIFSMLLKLGIAPLHNWATDLYSILALSMTFWFAILPKLAIFGLLLQIPISITAIASSNIMMSSAILLGFVVGSIGLMGQWQIGRFMAYSAIVHFSYFLLAFIANGRTAFIFYALIYAITVLNLFIVLHVMQSRITTKQPSNLFLIRTESLIRNRYLLPFAVSLFSLAAIPPLAGFYAKLLVLASGIHWIAIVAILASTLSAANYLSLGCNVIGFQQYARITKDQLYFYPMSFAIIISSPTITLLLATFDFSLLPPLTLFLSPIALVVMVPILRLYCYLQLFIIYYVLF